LANVFTEHVRKSYNFFDLLGNLGGVMQIFVFIFGLLIFPFSNHSFRLKLIENLLLVRTADKAFAQSTFLYANKDRKYIPVKQG
jgi:hypothetical protein